MTVKGDSGNLYGMLPPIVGMPVAMSDHIDGSPNTHVFEGRAGHVHLWSLVDKEASCVEGGTRIFAISA